MQLAHDADGRPARRHRGAAPRMEGRMGRSARNRARARAARASQVALGVEEIDARRPSRPLLGQARAEGEARDALGLHGEVGRVGLEAAPDLEEAHARLAAVQVRSQRVHQSAQQRRAHHAHVARDRIGEANRRGVAREVALPLLGNEAVADDLLVAERGGMRGAGRSGCGRPRAARASARSSAARRRERARSRGCARSPRRSPPRSRGRSASSAASRECRRALRLGTARRAARRMPCISSSATA